MRFNTRSFGPSIPPATKHLIIVNVIVWLFTFVSFLMWKSGYRGDPRLIADAFIDQHSFYKLLGLHFWQSSDFMPWQFFSHMFLHDPSDFLHILCNMFMLWMFGGWIERAMGTKRYLIYYFVCGLGAGFVQELFWQFTLPGGYETYDVAVFGASGAVFGLLLAFGMIFPKVPLYIMFIPVPIQARFVVLGYGVLELFFGVSGRMSGVAHFAHLGGMLFGILLILYWKNKGSISRGHGSY